MGDHFRMAVKLTTLPNTTVVTAGTPVRITETKIMVNAVFVQAHEDNVGNIYVGDENVSANRGTSVGPGQPLQYSGHPSNMLLSEFLISDVWIDAANDGDKVRIAYFKRKSYDSFS